LNRRLARNPQGSVATAHTATLKPAHEAPVDCVVAFGPDRGMFESNFPPDGVSSSYAVLWNAFKRLAARGGGCRSFRTRQPP
jgi:predicted TIM-barrel fold metal-dependent hydrolase